MNLPYRALRKIKRLFSPLISKQHRKRNKFNKELERLERFPRFKETGILIDNKRILVADSASFVFIYREVIEKEIYKFNSEVDKPIIIDCGANVGLSVIYFKQLYPQSEVIAFEPDPEIFKILEHNISVYDFQNVKLCNSALWGEEGEFDFYAEGADGGRMLKSDEHVDNIIKIKALKLSEFLNRPIHLLKIDIEGAEYGVLKECQSMLHNVERIFVEYHSFINESQYLDEILQLLKNARFRYYIQTNGVTSSNPFITINSYFGMDIQLNIFAYR